MLRFIIPIACLLLYILTGNKIDKDCLYIQCYATYIPLQIIQKFENEFGIHIVYDPQEETSMTELQILMNNMHHDIIILSVHPSRAIQHLFEIGLIAELPDKYKKIVPYNTPNNLIYIEDKLICMPYAFGTVSIAYNAAKIKHALGFIPHNPLDLVFDLEILKKLHNSNISITMLDSPTDVIYTLMLYLNIDIANYTKDDLVNACTHLIKLRRYYTQLSTLMCIQELQEARVDIVLSWIDLLRTGVTSDIYTIAQPDPAVLWMDCICIPKSSKNYDIACKFIEFLMRPDNVAIIIKARKLQEKIPKNARYNTMSNISITNALWKFWLKWQVSESFPQHKNIYLKEVVALLLD